MEFDFSGYATKNDLRCSDGRVIRKDAFKDNDGQKVPLVWQHLHNDPVNVLGHAVLENRQDGVYTYGKFNDTEAGQNAKMLVKHKDITGLSIYANKLVQKGSDVIHGAIREVSLVLAGANPGAFIDNVVIAHSDGTSDIMDEEAVIFTGLNFESVQQENSEKLTHEDGEKEPEEGEESVKTYGDIWDTLSEEQKDLVYNMLEQALESDLEEEEEVEHSEEESEEIIHEEGEDETMKKNVFETEGVPEDQNILSHSEIQTIFTNAARTGSLREAVLAHAVTYGIEDIGKLFPEVKLVDGMPGLISRDMEWVQEVMKSVKHSPFSRIKSTAMDITADEARARGYVKKGEKKKEEVVKALKRVTLPTTIYKKQKLDRDDIIDITDMDVVAWIKREMRVLIEEELARAYLIGDGRSAISDDKINEENIRPIYSDDDMYSHKVLVDNASVIAAIDDIIRARKNYKGAGRPVLFTTEDFLTDMLLVKDNMNRYIYNNETDLATKLRVSKIVEVPVMEGVTREDDNGKTLELIGIIVNLKDYVVGANQGGQLSMFDDFDIDYNQHKYLIETRCSGALVQPKAALVLEREPQDP